MDKCLIEECENEVEHRGLCSHHYPYAAKLISKGRTTWEELVEAGMALAPVKLVGKYSGSFLDMLEKKTGKSREDL